MSFQNLTRGLIFSVAISLSTMPTAFAASDSGTLTVGRATVMVLGAPPSVYPAGTVPVAP